MARKPGKKSMPIETLQEQAHDISRLMKILAHPSRLLIACQLAQGEMAVGDLETLLNIRQPGLSQQLALLREEGLVATRRQSKVIFYHLSDARLARMIGVLCETYGTAENCPRARIEAL
ncbi:MAG: metalloregulator ArsR/SmtB family transcription factor [Pseudomonadota bacterium]